MVEVLEIYYHKKILFVMLLLMSVILVLFYKSDDHINYQIFFSAADNEESTSDPRYVVLSSKCKIPEFEPLNQQAKPFYHPEKYSSCSKLELLTYITKNSENIATLHIDKEVAPSYTKNNISCCYAVVTRQGSKKSPDDGIKYSNCKNFNESVTLEIEENVINVKCKDTKTQKEIYENVHSIITINDELKSKLMMKTNKSGRSYSVIFVGIDSISRLNFIRTLPKTHEFLNNHNWITLKGYNKIADNTFPNLMAILTGYNNSRAYTLCDPTILYKLDNCPFLWHDFQKFGYVTAYAEDEININTFNYRKKGFANPPTDYYFRPYMTASEKLKITRKDDMIYCTGPETSGERILNVARDFINTFKEVPKFGFFWMNSFSHNKLMSPTRMDAKIREFLEDVTDSGVLNDTILIFLSDHGIRFGEFRYTPMGWLEERLPFIYISIPDGFKKRFPLQHDNIKKAQNKLTNPYDVHMTLQHILELQGYNYTVNPSDGCPSCTSLFKKIAVDRSCEEAAIEQHWCTCAGYTNVDPKNSTVKEAADSMVKQIGTIIKEKTSKESLCAKYSVHKIIQSSVSDHFEYKNTTYLLLVIETKPKAVFEATFLYERGANNNSDAFTLQGGISRLDWYYTHSKCVGDAYLKKYCYCR